MTDQDTANTDSVVSALPTALRGWFIITLLALIGIQFGLWRPLWLAALLASPLLLCAWFVWRGSLRAHAAAAYCGLAYLIHGLTETVANPELRSWAITETLLCVSLYLALLGIANTIRRWKRAS